MKKSAVSAAKRLRQPDGVSGLAGLTFNNARETIEVAKAKRNGREGTAKNDCKKVDDQYN